MPTSICRLLTQVDPIALRTIPPNKRLPCDVYVLVAEKLTRIRQIGEHFSSERLLSLHKHEVKTLFIPREQQKQFKDFLWEMLVSDDLSDEQRCAAVSDAAYLQTEAIFHAEGNLGPVIEETIKLFKDFGSKALAGASIDQLLSLAGAAGVSASRHAANVAIYSMVLARLVFKNDPDKIWQAGVAALLHDLGEASMDEAIRKDPRGVSPERWQEYQQHPRLAVDKLQETSLPEEIRRAIAEHHEALDGSGYPNGSRGDEISPLARVLAICDNFDSLTGGTEEKTRQTPDQALMILETLRPERFDPAMLALFGRNVRALDKQKKKEATPKKETKPARKENGSADALGAYEVKLAV